MTLRVVPLESVPLLHPENGVVETARASIRSQADALTALASRIEDEFCRAVELLVRATGRIVVTGMGKSGLIGRKISATLNCSGSPSVFLHPGDAAHGELGIVTARDTVIAISNSGETAEVVRLLPYFVELGVPVIALVGQLDSALGRAASVSLDISVERETCPHNLVPTTSALATLALGDALAMAAMSQRNFTAEDFGRFHPGGTLGAHLSSRVAHVMQTNDLPLVSKNTLLGEALLTMSSGRCGMVIAIDNGRRPLGVLTEGDLRRAVQSNSDALRLPLSEFMTENPITIREDASIREAEERMHRLRLEALVVIDSRHCVAGIIKIFNGQ